MSTTPGQDTVSVSEYNVTFKDDVTTLSLTTSVNVQDKLSFLDSLLLLSDDQRELSDVIQEKISLVAVAISLPLTFCNVIVFLQKDMRNATSLYVVGLSIAQLLYLIRHVIEYTLRAALPDSRNNFWYWSYMYYYVYFGMVAKRGSHVVTCLVSMERLYAVFRPLHIKDFFLSKRPFLCLVSAYLVAGVLHVYTLVKFSVQAVSGSKAGKTVYNIQLSSMYKRHQESYDALGLAAKGILTFMALPVQLVLNVLTIWALRRHNMATKRVQSSASEEAKIQKERQLTVTILATTVSYLILTLPWALHALFHSIFTEYWELGKYGNIHVVIGDFGANLTYVSCGVDFACFYGLSSNFRRTFFKLFGIQRVKKWLGVKDSESQNNPRKDFESTDMTEL
ncbi:hypothetical protein BaRGS_00011976, partial [Batillaria attramentaria]